MLNEIKNSKAFTLIELLVVIVILAILVLLAAPKLLGYTEKAKVAHIKNDIKAYETAIEIERNNEESFIEKWEVIATDTLKNHADEELLFNTRGIVDSEELTDEYYKVDRDLIPTKSELKGDFFLAKGGKVYYLDKENERQKLSVSSEEPEPMPEGCFVYQVSEEEGYAMILDYDGECGSDVVIPNEFEGYPVLIIGTEAFEDKGLTSVKLPNGLFGISSYAFFNNEITSIDIPESLALIYEGAFGNNNIQSLDLPDTLKSVGAYAFSKNDIKTLSLSKGVSELTEGVFLGNSNLKSVNIIPEVEVIGYGAFYEAGLTSIDIPDTVKTLGSNAFQGNKLKSVNIGKGITKIPDYAFQMNQIEEIIIPDNITDVGNYAFSHNNIKYVEFSKNMRYIRNQQFWGNDLEEVTIPNQIWEVGVSAFEDNNLKEVIVENPTTFFKINVFHDNHKDLTVKGPKNSSIEKYIEGLTFNFEPL